MIFNIANKSLFCTRKYTHVAKFSHYNLNRSGIVRERGGFFNKMHKLLRMAP